MSEILIEEFLAESKKEDSKFFLVGPVSMHSRRNQNFRVYPREVLNREMNKYITEHVEKNNAYGHGDHPDNLKIELDKISHRIISLKEDGDLWIGKSIVSDTPKGKIIKALMEDGGSIGMSTRAGGSVKVSKDGTKIVQEDMKLMAIDAVVNPSCQEAVMDYLYEEKETFFCESEQCYMLVEDINKNIKKASKKDLEKTMLEQFERYCKALNFKI